MSRLWIIRRSGRPRNGFGRSARAHGARWPGFAALALVACACVVAPASAQQAKAPADKAPITREEYERLQKQINQLQENYNKQLLLLKAQLKALQQRPSTPTAPAAPSAASPPAAPPVANSEVEQRLSSLELRVKDVQSLAEANKPGINNFVVTGFGSAGYTNAEGSNSTFEASFNPIFLYKLGERAFAETELEIGLDDTGETTFELETANFSYIVNDHLSLIGGKFLTPLSTFKEHLHPTWINKLPDQPLFAEGPRRLVPTTSIGFQGRGAFEIGKTKLTYAAYVTNGFSLETGAANPSAGQLSFENPVGDLNNSKSVGGRIGFFPIPALEVVYAMNLGNVNGPGIPNTTALVQDVGVSYVKESAKIHGKLDVRGELVFSDVNNRDFGTGIFNNNRTGGYAQVAYRPTMSGSFFRNVEGVFRYDFVDQPSKAPTAFDESRYTFGLNYWFNPSTVLKFAYQVDAKSGATMNNDAFMIQFALGF